MKEHLKLLGFKVTDIVTGFSGFVTSISFDLYGCVQAVVQPYGLDKDGNSAKGQWFDTKRLTTTESTPVMPVPDFGIVPGGQELPPYPDKLAQ